MRSKTLALAATLTFAVSGAALAQTPAGGGSAEGNMNNPGSVKSNSEKSMERSTGSATGTAGTTGTGMAPMAPGAAGGTSGGSMGSGTGAGSTGPGGAAGGR